MDPPKNNWFGIRNRPKPRGPFAGSMWSVWYSGVDIIDVIVFNAELVLRGDGEILILEVEFCKPQSMA